MITYVVNFNEIAADYVRKLKQHYKTNNGFVGKEYLTTTPTQHYIKRIVVLDSKPFNLSFNGNQIIQTATPTDVLLPVPLEFSKCEINSTAEYFCEMVVLE